jgi:molecular chaperone GrpE
MSKKKEPLTNTRDNEKEPGEERIGAPASGQTREAGHTQQSAEKKQDEAQKAQETRPDGESAKSEPAELETPQSEEGPTLSADEIAKLVKEKEEYYDRLLRTQADFDNYRKRVQKETANLLKYGAENALREILPVVDNLDRALDSARKHTESNSQLIEGIEMIMTQFRNALEKLGVKSIETVGHPFDPNKHDALLRVHAPGVTEGAVLNEIRKGYYFYDKVLRPAQVTVGAQEEPLGSGQKPDNQTENG